MAHRRSFFWKSGHSTSKKHSSAYSACHSRKPDSLRSPPVRMTRSGSGTPARRVSRASEMCASVMASAGKVPSRT
eukprot:scaffold965_cov262-Pinguiococcus_pyrenoidosus.AAC.24